ncbi:MAG: CoB--CoM heterodisulfide reductase iron-sulfur subunit A family protein [Candidatus Lokiarchaeota archaeon]
MNSYLENKEKEIDKEARVGVFICHCGSNIGGLINCEDLAKYANKLPHVSHSEDNLYTCSETGLASIKKAIKEYDLNRVVVASCTPRTHEPLFRECISEEGLNPYLFNFVNIRDQCTWVHMKDPEGAFKKAKDLVRMGVSKAAKLKPLEKVLVDINPSALIIGAGVSGMSAALSLSSQGYKTYLVEKEKELGGRLNSLHTLFPHNTDASELLDQFKEKVYNSSNLHLMTSSTIKNIDGYVGNYHITVENEKIHNLEVGIIIVAVGASVLTPYDLFGYDGKTRMTQLEFEQKLKDDKIKSDNIIMIQCVGSKNKERPYCSNVCCMTSIKNALIYKEKNPKANIFILFRDIYTPGTFYEEYYRKAREKGIIFIKYEEENPPEVEEKTVKVYNKYINEDIIIPYDNLILATPLIANEDNKELAQMLKVPLEANKFFLEAHVKLRPVDFATDGVFVSGSAKWPINISEAISQGLAAASRASTILSHNQIETEGATSYLPEWNKDLCKGCGICIKVCPYNAIKKNEDDEIEIIQALCKGCGVCGASCTKRAIEIKHFTNEQIISEILALGGREII